LKYLAQKAIICQLKNLYHKARNKRNVLKNIDLKELAYSYGLIQVPKISFNTNANPKEDEVNNKEELHEIKGTKKSRKLEKLKRKIKMKKKRQKMQTGEDIEDKFLIKNIDGQLNELRENPLMKRGDGVVEMEEVEEGFLTKKHGPVVIEDLNLKNIELSKRKLKKIKYDGPYGGKNIKEIDSEGKLKEQGNRFKEKYKGETTHDRVGQFKSKLGRL
jgi:hypothetical protein